MQIDKTSRNELQIFPSDRSAFSLITFLDFTETYGGQEQLRKFLSSPSSDIDEISQRQELFRFLMVHREKWQLPVTGKEIFSLESYLNSNVAPIRTSSTIDSFLYGYWYKLRHRAHFSHLTEGLQKFKTFFERFFALFHDCEISELPALLQELQSRFQTVAKEMEDKGVAFSGGQTAFKRILQYDYFFRANIFGRVIPKILLDLYYALDAYVSLSKAMETHKFVFPDFTFQPEIHIEGIYHPALANPVPNDLSFVSGKQFMFLTGPNMAGKTTLMKSVGLAVYMAHLGLGVSAQSMRLCVQKRLFVNMNNEDNLVNGESYFLNEVKRVVEAAKYISQGEQCLLIFDELFKGTNVKDAMDCSQLMVEKISGHLKASVIFSSHLYELAPVISPLPTVFFRCFDVKVADGQHHFTYQLKSGVSDVRMGLLILKQSGIESLL